MDKEKIEELKSKRLQLQEEVRLKELKNRVASQISFLENSGESYLLFAESENLNWIHANVRTRNRDDYAGIHGFFQIDVDDSKAISSMIIDEKEINSTKFKAGFSSLIPTTSKLIVCHQGGDPELEISATAFLNNPSEFFAKPETWILSTDKKWIIEYIWDQEVIRFIQLQGSAPTLIMKIILGNQ